MTRKEHSQVVLFLKGGAGSGNYKHRGRKGIRGGSLPKTAGTSASAPVDEPRPAPPKPPVLPPSDHIKTEPDAKRYWAQFIRGKTVTLHAKSGGSFYKLAVTFGPDATHMWSRKWEPGDPLPVAAYDNPVSKRGARAFDLDRARYMSLLFEAISNPWRIIDDRGDDLYIVGRRLPDGRNYTVVLKVDAPGRCSFLSAYPRSPQKIAQLIASNKPRIPGGLTKQDMMKADPPALSEKGWGGSNPDAHGLLAHPVPDRLGRSPLHYRPFEQSSGVAARDNVIAFFDMFKALAAGERWITIRAPGHEKGQPVLIRQEPDGAARVIGGAGGALNHLKLTSVRSVADYKQEAAKRVQARAEAKKRQRELDKRDGLVENKKAAREVVRDQRAQQRNKFIKTVAETMGWKPEDLRFPEEKYQNASEAATRKAAEKHLQGLLARAKEAVDTNRKALVEDGELRQKAGLGEVPLTGEKPDQLSVQDLDPVAPATKGFGYSTDYGKRAEERGLTAESLAEEAAASKPAQDPTKAAATDARKATAQKVATELKDIRDPGPPVDPHVIVEGRKAVALLKAEKELKEFEKVARKQSAKIDDAREAIEPKAYLLETISRPVDEDLVKDLDNELHTIKTRAFLEEVGRQAGGADSLGRHVGVGAYNSINALALAAGGASLVDRSVVDVLGVAGAAEVLARRLKTDMTAGELDNIRGAMERFHVDHYMQLSDSALREARECQDLAAEIDLGEVSSTNDLAAMQEMNARRRDLVQAAQRTLGTALGEMEANAALVAALRNPRDKLELSMGKTSIEDAIKQARAIGLDRGDYQIDRVGASTLMTVTGAGMDKLAKPIAKADLQRTKQAMDIIEGRQDEENWLPEGVARRPDLAMNILPGTAPQLAKPFPKQPKDMRQAVEDFIGQRAADGASPADIVAALLSEDTLQAAGDRQAFMAEVDRIAPLYGADGKMIRAETHQEAFEKLAEAYCERAQGADLTPLHRQQFKVDETSVDALHRALAEHPEGAAAFKPVGDLTAQDQGALRAAFAAEYGRSDPAAEGMRRDLADLDAKEPEKEVDDMFGRGPNPEHSAWLKERNALAEKLNASSMTWGKYLSFMGSPTRAYAAMQDVVRSKVLRSFADQHNRLRPGSPLKVGRTVISGDLDHLDALDPGKREQRLAQHRELVDGLRNRVAGRYATGGVSDKIEAARAAEEAAKQSQMGLFGMEEPAAPKDAPDAPPRPLDLGERWSLGHAAERQIAGMMPIVGKQFKAGQPVKLWQPNMSGAYVGRQRAVKLIEHNGHQVLGLGVGAGKTSIALASLAHLKSKGKAKRGIFAVPSIVQGQFHGEALTMLQPGKFNWHCDPGASREERIAAYKNPDVDFSVVTHQALRDDLLHLAAKRESVTPSAVAEKLDKMKPAERSAYMRELMDAEGIDHDYLAVDEGHNLLNRSGKANSNMANVIDALSDKMPYYVSMTADPVKNDASEAFDVLSKMDRERYSDRDAFLRKYGVDTEAAKDGLRREMARHFYLGKIDPGVKVNKTEVPVELDENQKAQLKAIDQAVSKAKLARMKGGVDVDAMKQLSAAAFDGVDPAQHEAIARDLQRSIGILKDAAVHHAINGGAKTEALAKVAGDRRGKPGVVFARRRERVEEIAARLQKDGHRVVVLTGSDSAKEKDRKKREFTDGKHDIIVCSDAAAVGANLQRGQWLAQYDTPQTAMLHAQRAGRIHRMGQKNDVDLIDLVANHPAERQWRKRLSDKYDLRDIMTSPLEGLDDRGVGLYLKQQSAGKAEEGAALHPPVASQEPDEQLDLLAA